MPDKERYRQYVSCNWMANNLSETLYAPTEIWK